MTKLIERLFVFLLGKHLALRLRLYVPEGISPDNKVVYSYIYGIDDQERAAAGASSGEEAAV